MQKSIVQLLPISFAIVLFFFARLVTAEVCNEAGYPDQYLFVGCAPMEWNADNSATELGTTATRMISVSGGRGPYTWTVNGNGFYLDSAYSKKSITTDATSMTLYTNNACGAGEVSITDACGFPTQGAVRSIQGVWVLIGNGKKVIPEFTAPFVSVSPNGLRWAAVSGKYRTEQEWWGVYGCTKTPVNCNSWQPESYGHFALSYPSPGAPFYQFKSCSNGWVITYENLEDTAGCSEGYHKFKGRYAFGGYQPNTFEWRCN